MKYLYTIPILFLLIFSSQIPVEASVLASSREYVNLRESSLELNANNINTQNDDVVQVFSYNNSQIYLTKADIDLMAQIVYAESKGEPFEGKVAVASVILNRVLTPGFPSTIQEVIFQPNAFSCVVDGQISVIPNDECYNAVYEAVKGNDPTNEALFFYNPSIATCSWMAGIEKTDSKSIGQHLFFKTY